MSKEIDILNRIQKNEEKYYQENNKLYFTVITNPEEFPVRYDTIQYWRNINDTWEVIE